MAGAKDIIVRVIPPQVANPFVERHHYSGKVCNNSQLHFGCFLGGRLHGVMSFGPSLQKRAMLGLVQTDNKGEHAKWNEWLELNRMAFDDVLPRNSESRCLAIAFRLIRKNAPQIKWIVSYSDGTASGDGTIYRASGFHLTGIKRNQTILVLPDGERIAKNIITNGVQTRAKYAKKLGINKLWGGGERTTTNRRRSQSCAGLPASLYQAAFPGCSAARPGHPVHRNRRGGGGYVPGKAEYKGEQAQKKGALR